MMKTILDEYIIPYQFPVSKPNKDVIAINATNITDYYFDDSKLLYFMLYSNVPSNINYRIEYPRIKDLLKLLKDEGFAILRISEDFEPDTMDYLYFTKIEENIFIRLCCTKIPEEDEDNDVEEDEFEDNSFYSMSSSSDEDTCSLELSYALSDYSASLIKKLNEYQYIEKVEEEDKCIIHMFEKGMNGSLRLVPHNVDKFELDINKHYNDDFVKAHDKISKWISDYTLKNNRLVMLSGKAGTGKTNYIKTLMHETTKLRKIYIPPYYVDSIADPGFFTFIKRYSNSLIIVEDAEKVLISRDLNPNNTAMSALLNLTDGILASVLNFKVVVTYNTSDKDIDTAITRKGRLFMKYYFDKLEEHKTKKLFEELYGKSETPPEKEMTLADIYEHEPNGAAVKEERKIGFC